MLNPCDVCHSPAYAGIGDVPTGDELGHRFRAYFVGCEHCRKEIYSIWSFADLVEKWNTENKGEKK